MADQKFTYSRKRFFLFFFCWWLFLAVLHAFVLHRLGLSWRISMLDALVSNSLLGTITLSAVILYKYYQPGKENRMFRLIYALGITFLFCSILSWLLGVMLPLEDSYQELVERSMPLRFVVAFMVVAFITILNWLWNNLEEQKMVMIRKNESEQLAREAELFKLRQQLQPHFLFNSLNSISALAISKPEEARSMMQKLSDFLRGTLKKDENKTVHLNEELKQLSLYLEIEQVRFGNRLRVTIDADDPANTATIPPLILQPLMENAIKFGLYGTLDDVEIRFTAKVVNGLLEIEISNPFDADSRPQKNGTGFGLSAVGRRLQLLYGRNDLLITESTPEIFTCTVKIPQQDE